MFVGERMEAGGNSTAASTCARPRATWGFRNQTTWTYVSFFPHRALSSFAIGIAVPFLRIMLRIF